MLKGMKIRDIVIKDKFWSDYLRLVKDEVIPYQWEALNDRVEGAEPSCSIKNYRIAAGLEEGEFHGYVFQDTDLTKWIEAASYRLEAFPDMQLEKTIDEMIELIGKAQQPDGYLNTFFTIKEPENRWLNERDRHELYCAGHMIEAAVAYYDATGKENFLKIAYKFADYIDRVFGPEKGKKHGYPGHQVIEMALLRLYHISSNEKYLRLCKYFIDERGQEPHYFTLEKLARIERFGKVAVEAEPYNKLMKDNYEYNQAHLPVRDQKKATGHAVRAVYMYAAMAELADMTGDKALMDATRALWDNTTKTQMYITGALGSDEFGEAFSFDYDMPNDRTYAETCASVGLVFWAQRMINADPDSRYGDVMETALYNGTISGMSLDGRRFFYVNPLEVVPEICEKRHDTMHVAPVRQKWFGCSCCPPNLARMIASIGKYVYSSAEDKIFVNLFIASEADFKMDGQKVRLEQHGNYPWDGDIKIDVITEKSCKFSVAVRVPGWCRNAIMKVNGIDVNICELKKNGYAYITRHWDKGDTIEISMPMQIERMQANPKVRANAGKIALQRGPVVYCLEEVDNGPYLQNICLKKDSNLETHFEKDLLGGVMVITGRALRNDMNNWGDTLYGTAEYGSEEISLKAVPYYAWENRKPGEMLVWIREA